MAKVNLDITGKDKGASTAVKGVTKSIITAQLAVEGIKLAATALINVGKKSIENFKTQEQVLAKLQQQTGGNTASIEAWTSEIQAMTTIGDEASQQMASLGLSMGITEDKLEEATKGAIGLSEAMGIDLNTSMKMVALANEGEYNMLARYIPALRSATTDSEKMAIVQEAMANGFDIAQARADTFTGKLEQLKNIQGDNFEAFGRIVSVIGKDYVDSMTEAQKSLNKFLNNEKNIGKIAAAFEVLKTAIVDLIKLGFEKIKAIISPIKDELDELFGTGQEGVETFDILGIAVKFLSIALTLTVKAAKMLIIAFIDVITIAKNTVETLGAFWKAASGEGTWKEAINSVKKIGESYKDLGKNIVTNVSDMVTSTIDEFKDLNSGAEEAADKYAEIWDKKNKEVIAALIKARKELEEENKKKNKNLGDDDEEFISKNTNQWQTWMNNLISMTQSLNDQIMEMQSGFIEGMLEKNQEWQEAHIEQIDEWMTAEMERRGVAQETKQEQLNNEIAALQKKLAKEVGLEQKATIQKQINEKKEALERQKIIDAGEKKKQKILEKADKKERQLKREQFEREKGFRIANVWINAAAGIAGAWGMGISQLGPIAGSILAGIMTGVILAVAGAQTGVIASQTFHGQEGGEVPIGTLTGDRAVTYMNKGEALLRGDDYKSLVQMARNQDELGGGVVNNGQIIIQPRDPEEFYEELNETMRFEGAR